MPSICVPQITRGLSSSPCFCFSEIPPHLVWMRKGTPWGERTFQYSGKSLYPSSHSNLSPSERLLGLCLDSLKLVMSSKSSSAWAITNTSYIILCIQPLTLGLSEKFPSQCYFVRRRKDRLYNGEKCKKTDSITAIYISFSSKYLSK